MISLNWTLILQIVNFLVLLVILNKLLFEPIMQIIDKRAQETEGREADARNLTRQSEEKAEEYAQKVKEAKLEANTKKQEIRAVGLKEEEKLLGSARVEGEAVLNKIREQIAKEAEAAKEDLAQQAQEMSKMIFGKLMGRSLS